MTDIMEDQKRLLNSKEAATYLGLKEQTMHNWRHKRKPPNYVQIGSRCLYEKTELDKFIDSNRVEFT